MVLSGTNARATVWITIVDNGRKKTMFCLLLDTALKTVAYRWQVIQIVETLAHRQIRFIPIKEGIEFDGQQDPRPQGAVERHFADADLSNRIRNRHTLAMQNISLPELRDDLFGLVASLYRLGPPLNILIQRRSVA